jgi:hypothetical protein
MTICWAQTLQPVFSPDHLWIPTALFVGFTTSFFGATLGAIIA